MKTFKTILNSIKILFILVTISALFTTCDVDALLGAEDDCKNDVNTEIERTFNPTVKAYYSDGSAYEGYLSFEISKQYCDGYMPTNGIYQISSETNSGGIWDVGWTYTYKFKYELDFVLILIKAATKDSDGLWLRDEVRYRYYYHDVKDQSSIPTNYVINLTWSPIG